MKTSEFLTNARVFIEDGWHQGDYSDGTSCVCAYGALYAAEGQPVFSGLWGPSDTPATVAAVDALNDTLTRRGDSRSHFGIVYFNDAFTTTKQDVLDLFDETIAYLKGQGL